MIGLFLALVILGPSFVFATHTADLKSWLMSLMPSALLWYCKRLDFMA